jgi:F-type H+-transporting ATPase subunit b
MIMFSSKYLSLSSAALLLPSVALAAGDKESKGGLPQLDISTWPTQLFWLVVTFIIAYILMSRLVTPKIGSVLENRSATIARDLDSAKAADAEAKATFDAYEKSLADAREAAATQAAAAMAEAKANAQTAEDELSKKLNRKVKTAETKLATMRAEAMENLEDIAADAAGQAVKQLAGISATKAVLSKHIKKAAQTIAPQEAN